MQAFINSLRNCFVSEMSKAQLLNFCKALLFLLPLWFSSCSTPSSTPFVDEPTRHFLEHVMIREKGLFTLLGSKPMTEFDVTNGTGLTEEEMFQDFEKAKSYWVHDHNEEATMPATYEDFLKYWRALFYLNNKKHWLIWKEQQVQYLGKRYLMVERPTPFGDGKMGLFVNVPLTTYLLHKHQKEFETTLGFSFDPETILNEIIDPDSVFWTRSFQSHYLFGLLMGYGDQNAFLFSWHQKAFPHSPLGAYFDHIPSAEPSTGYVFKKKVSVQDLSLPLFGTFTIYDETREQYRNERKKILEFYIHKDFAQTTLSLLKFDH